MRRFHGCGGRVLGAGGSLLKALGALAGSKSVDWAKWHVFFGDERNVPHSHADSTLKVPSRPRQNIQSLTPNRIVITCHSCVIDVYLSTGYFSICFECLTRFQT